MEIRWIGGQAIDEIQGLRFSHFEFPTPQHTLRALARDQQGSLWHHSNDGWDQPAHAFSKPNTGLVLTGHSRHSHHIAILQKRPLTAIIEPKWP